eukprot:TRINITY_DN20114_c0_g1_i1.p1 TRINITY_DN20114_c0_g1~~TRINITY_DN20114_c0_g1_i1.p1  ORF type:complete len:3142 (+),score=853.36 TRINITY_DN20114_c0_g1_i1:147-9572(+)
MSGLAAGLKGLFKAGRKKSSNSEQGKEGGGGGGGGGTRLQEANEEVAEESLGWAEIKKVIEAQKAWSGLTNAGQKGEWESVCDVATCVSGWGGDHQALVRNGFKKAFDEGTAIACTISRLLAAKVRGALQAGGAQDTLDVLSSGPFSASMHLTAWMCSNIDSTVVNIASASIPSLIVAFLQSLTTLDLSQAHQDAVFSIIFPTLRSLVIHPACVDDLTRGGYLRTLLDLTLQALNRPGISDFTARVMSEASDLLILASHKSLSQVAALKPITTILTDLQKHVKSPKILELSPLPPPICVVHVASLRFISEILRLLDMQHPAPVYANQIMGFNRSGVDLCATLAITSCHHEAAESVVMFANLVYVSPQGGESGDALTTTQSESIFSDRVRAPSIMFTGQKCDTGSTLAKNSAVFSLLPKVAEESNSATAQQRVAECMMKIFSDHVDNYSLLHKTQVLPKLLHKVGALHPMGQLSVIQVLQFVVQQLNYRPEQAIFIAVHKVGEKDLPPRLVTSLLRMFIEFIKLDPTFRIILKDAGLTAACSSFFKNLAANAETDASPQELAKCTEAALDACLLMMEGSSEAAQQHLSSLTKNEGVVTMLRCATSKVLCDDIRKAMRRFLLSAAALDALREERGGILEALMSYLNSGVTNVGVDWTCIGVCLGILLRVVATQRSCRPVFSRLSLAGGTQVPLSLLRPLSGIGKTPTEPDPPREAPAVTRLAWALAAVMSVRHTPDLGTFSGASKSLVTVLGPHRAVWDMLYAAVGYWLDASTHDALINAVETPENMVSTLYYIDTLPTCVMFPAALSGALVILPQLKLSEARCVLDFIQNRLPDVPLLVPGDVAAANAVVDLAEKEWNDLTNDFPMLDFLGNSAEAASGVLEGLIPNSVSAWCQPSHIRRLAALAKQKPGPVAQLQQIAKCLSAVAKKPKKTNQVAFNGITSSVVTMINPSIQWPSAGITVSCWFEFIRPPSTSGEVATQPGPIIARLSWIDQENRKLFMQLGIDGRNRLVLVSNYVNEVSTDMREEPTPQLHTFSDYEFRERVKYHIAFVHHKQAMMKMAKSEAVLYVNGGIVQRIPVVYPPATQHVSSRLKASCGLGRPRATRPFTGDRLSGGRLQVAQLRIMGNAVCSASVLTMYALGPTYQGPYDSAAVESLAASSMTSSACPVLTPAQVALLDHPANNWPDGTESQPDLCIWLLLPSTGADQSVPVVSRSNGVPAEPVYSGNVVSMVWMAPVGSVAVMAAQRGVPQLLLGWAIEHQVMGLGTPSTQAIKETILAVLNILRCAADADPLVASDYSLHEGISHLLRTHPSLCDAQVVEAVVYAAMCNGAVRSLPLVRQLLLDSSLWEKCTYSSAALALQHLRQCVCDGKMRHFNALRLQRGADMTRALLYLLLGEPGRPPHRDIMRGALETLEHHLVALSVDQFSLETAVLDICRFTSHIVKETGFEGISTQQRHLVTNRLLHLILNLVISGKPSYDTGFGMSRQADFIGAAVMQAFNNVAGISPKIKRKQPSKDPFTEALLQCTDIRWFMNILEHARHPVLTVLTLRLLGRTFVASSDRIANFKKAVAASRVLGSYLGRHCNQPEVYAAVVGLLCDSPGKDHTGRQLLDISKEDAEGDHPLFGCMLPVAFAMASAAYGYTSGLGKPPYFLQPVSSSNTVVSFPTSSPRARWAKLLGRVSMFTALKARLGLLKLGCEALSPKERGPPLVGVNEIRSLADDTLKCVAACLRTGGTRLDAFMKNDEMLGMAVEVAFATVSQAPVIAEESVDDFVIIDNDPADQVDGAGDSDGDNASDDSNLSYHSLDMDTITSSPMKSSGNWESGESPFPEDFENAPILQVIACGICGAVLRDAPWVVIARSRKSRRSTERDSPATALLHRVLNSCPPTTQTSAQTAFQLAVVKALLTAMHSAIDIILSETAFLQNAVDVLSYLTTRLYAGHPTPVPELMNLGSDIIHGMESRQLIPFKGLWTSFVNRVSLWLLSPVLHPRDLPVEYGINTLLASLPVVLHATNNETVFLQPLVFLLHELMKAHSFDIVQDKVLVVMRLLVDTFRNSPSLAEVFVSPKRNLLQGGFDQLDGTVAGTTRFKTWAIEQEHELNEFFAQKHHAAYQKWKRKEEKQKAWLKVVSQETRVAVSEFMGKQEARKRKYFEWAAEYSAGTEMDPSVFEWPASTAALLRCSPCTVLPPFGTALGIKWPLRCSGKLGPCVPAHSDEPIPKVKKANEDRKDEHSAYRLSCMATTDDGLIPLRVRIHTPPMRVVGQVESETIEGLNHSATWFCNAITMPCGDTAQHVFNASRVWYLESIPTLVIVGQKSIYLASHCRRNEQGDIEYYPAKVTRTGPPVNTAETPIVKSKQSRSAVGGLLAHGWKGLKGVVRPGILKQKADEEEKQHRVLLSMTLVHLFSQGYVMEIPLCGVLEVVKRRTHHEDVAVEITTDVGKAYLLTVMNQCSIMSEKERNRLYKVLVSNAPYAQTVEQAATLADVTHMWRVRMITNYDYILTVNAIAGRTFSDLNQYPVIPWVLAAYDTPAIDLSNVAVYRDLSKPMGALDSKRAASFEARYSEWEHEDIPKFHYGSHYSTPMMVLWYLTRLQPYTSMAVVYQGGKLDLADRLFHSVADAWHSASRGSNTDVKELIPEFYTSSEFLLNTNALNLGANREGIVLGDVVLPPWATSPEHFIAVQRAALESEYVSTHLHQWLDLVFGSAQLGEEAQKKLNVFYHLSYEGGLAKVVGTAEDPGEKWAAATQVAQFGQTPKQLWNTHHQQRSTAPLTSTIRLLSACRQAQASKCYQAVVFSVSGDYQPGSSFSWVNAANVEGCGQVMLLSPGLGRLGTAQGYIDLTKRDGFARVYGAGDGQLLGRMPLPCGVKGSSAVATLWNSAVVFCGTANGILAMQVNSRNVPGAVVWGSSAHPTFKSIKPLYRMVCHWGPVDRLIHVPETTLLLSASNDGGPPAVWHVGHRQGTYCGLLKEHKGVLMDAKVLPSRRWLFTCSADTVYIYHTKDLSKLARVRVPDFSSSIGSVTAVEPLALPEREHQVPFLTGHSSGKIALWSVLIDDTGAITKLSFELVLPHAPQRGPVTGILQRPPPFAVKASGLYYQTVSSDGFGTFEKQPFAYSAHSDGSVLQWNAPPECLSLWPSLA